MTISRLVEPQALKDDSKANVVRAMVYRHDGDDLNLTSALVAFEQFDRIEQPFSSWSATFKLDNPEQNLSVADDVHDDDWLEVHVSTWGGDQDTLQPLQLGPVDAVRTRMQVDPLGVQRWNLGLAGRSWSKVLTDTFVSTWQRLRNDVKFPGSVMSPHDATKFTNEMVQNFAGTVTGKTSPGSYLEEVLNFLLRDQWLLPFGVANRENYTMRDWLNEYPPVQTGGVSEVDGTVWKGLSLVSGIRATIWDVLQAFQNDPALIELWPGWIIKKDGPIDRLHPALFYRNRPFSQEKGMLEMSDWQWLQSYAIPMQYVTAFDLGKSGAERFNVGLVSPAILNASMETTVLASDPNLPWTDNDSIRRHGTRAWFVEDHLVPPKKNFLHDRTRQKTDFIAEAYSRVPDLYSGTLVTSGWFLPPTVVGAKVVVVNNDGTPQLEFYCEGLDTRIEIDVHGVMMLTQTISVTRGENL